ncbi:hypothetical protein CAPTEDRAFT_226670 [Capitella teleta]|uniref:Kinesin-like protein n=1 Tax=Capitella teleta TaxID=283909 RepID=R7UDI7_CAPTE|nr:hypothetical protein CAPTEDRAFT_226670 [Capitella teleta]|eukprot:ELU04176.1 hypothetical protein CAPTEDRAFT_226670 [Capitella teleta]
MNGFEVQTEADAMLERQHKEIMPKMNSVNDTPRKEKYDHSVPRVRDTTRVENLEEDNNYAVFVSYVEIYNNYIYDLLEELQYDAITGYKPPTSRVLREDSTRNMYVSSVTEVEVKSTEEAYEVLWKGMALGQRRRRVAHTALNTESSRSHSVFNVRLVQAPLDPRGEEVLQDKDKVCVSQLALVDLAGSERTGRTNSTGDRLKEAGNINQSLMALRACIEALRESQTSNISKMVPYRDSRLTHLFKNYFDGEGKVRMVVCVNPMEEEYDESLQVMKFAELTREVQVARPQQVRFDIGLARGRRHLRDQIRTEVAENPTQLLTSLPPVYDLGPLFPSTELLDPADEVTLRTLIDFLRRRETTRTTLIGDLSSREDRFRTRLLEIERQNQELKSENQSLRKQLDSNESQSNKIHRQVRSLEKANEALQRTASQFEQEKKGLERELDDKEYRMRKAMSDKDRLKQDFNTKMALTEHEVGRQLEQAKRKLKNESQQQLRAKQQKLEMLRTIINDSDVDSVTSQSSVGTPMVTRPRSRTVTSRYLAATGRGSIIPARSEPDLSSIDSANDSRPPHSSLRNRTPFTQPVNKAVPRTTRNRSPPPVKPKPVVNPRIKHRRSKSSNDVWLDHKPTNTVDTGTILQPNIKKKKSVNQLSEKATREASKYLLTHQEMDSDDNLTTKLVKGHITRTSAGGSAVVFDDVETIKQTSPGDRKRRSPALRPEDFEGEWTDTETRCKIAVEGHGQLKRIKTSAV